MKLSFSTLACYDFEWTDIYSMAKDLGFDGIEIRGLGKDIFSVKAKPFTEKQLPVTISKLKSLGIEISCFSSGATLRMKEKSAENKNEIIEYIKLASKMGTSFVRILADDGLAPSGLVDDDFIISELKELSVTAEEYNVTLLVETNGDYCDTKRLCKVLESVGSRKVGALWDMHHPYRFCGEDPKTTVANLGEHIKYTHIKDSIINNGKLEYKLMGEGDLPIKDMLCALSSINYGGFVTL
ncbi:MAG: sugar phosphate isomerase/epimerase, partial [Ruminiclostridium sp.]|nr:sugar phosphate isomerase/epimerase [Ruminiclostridium sp.]